MNPTYIMTFNYTDMDGHLKLKTNRLAADIGENISPASWDGYVKSRAQEPQSCMDVHLIATWEGPNTYARLIPVRFSAPAIYDGLKTKVLQGSLYPSFRDAFPHCIERSKRYSTRRWWKFIDIFDTSIDTCGECKNAKKSDFACC
jgi:hypothetical protein